METRRLFVQLKSVDTEQRIIEGMASSSSTDRMGDIVEPRGAKFKLPLRLLWQHDKDMPLGDVIEAKVTDAGIRIRAKIAKDVVPYIEEKWALIKAGLVTGLSIGFRPIEYEPIKDSKTFGMRFKEWEWLELSAVTIAANQDASIEMIKALDDRLLAVAGEKKQSDVVRLENLSPGGTGKTVSLRGNAQVKTTAERITEFEAKHVANKGRQIAIIEAANEAGRTLDDAEQQEFDTLEIESEDILKHVGRLKKVAAASVERAEVITNSSGMNQAVIAKASGSGIISVKSNLPKATAFTRYCQALAVGKGNLMQSLEISKRWKDSTPEVEEVLKAAVTAGTTTDADWAQPLVAYQTMVAEFIELLRPATIIGQIPGLRRVPFNIRVAGTTQGSTVGWVGEGASKPVSEMKFTETLLGWAKAAGIVVITKELARFSAPAAEDVIRTDLRDSMAQFLDEQFVDPAVAVSVGVHPASVTNTATGIPSTGGTMGDIYTDLTTLFGNLAALNISPATGVFVTTPAIAIGLTMMMTTQGIRAFPDMSMTGGTLLGFPVVVSDAVPAGLLIFIVAREVFLADDGDVTIDASEQASVQLDSAPPTPAVSLVSLWQQNLVGIRAERYINWAKRRAGVVQFISGVTPAPTAPLAP